MHLLLGSSPIFALLSLFCSNLFSFSFIAMARSWDEISDDQKYVYLLEGLVRNRVETPIACCLCENIFFGNGSFIRHCQSYHNRDGTLKQGLHLGNFLRPENVRNFFPSTSRLTRQNGRSIWQNVIPNPPNLSSATNRLVPTLLRNPVQLRRHISTHRSQPYPSLSNFRSAINRATFSSQRRQSSNFGSGFGSQPTGLPNLRSPVNPIAPGMFTSRSVQLPTFHSSGRPGASASPPVQLSNFRLPLPVGASASYSVPGTSNLSLGRTIRSRMLPARRAAVRDHSDGYAEPYIWQQDQPTQATVMMDDEALPLDFNLNNRILILSNTSVIIPYEMPFPSGGAITNLDDIIKTCHRDPNREKDYSPWLQSTNTPHLLALPLISLYFFCCHILEEMLAEFIWKNSRLELFSPSIHGPKFKIRTISLSCITVEASKGGYTYIPLLGSNFCAAYSSLAPLSFTCPRYNVSYSFHLLTSMSLSMSPSFSSMFAKQYDDLPRNYTNVNIRMSPCRCLESAPIDLQNSVIT
ncbi:hypothetical protein ACJIZ3_017086 [Penstemon smallii]|uniref:C2H2-type domain-containing protein n=1 Tax=Penstemon smallii TaxID=265156 RepID=A0ABD3SUK1_9LAMI